MSLSLVVIFVQAALQERVSLGAADCGGGNSPALTAQCCRATGQTEPDSGHGPQLTGHAALPVDADVLTGQGGVVGPRCH